jgi:hypothetical protein
MVVTQITGGLGNQMFQYAVARAISLRTGQSLLLDLRHFENKNTRKFVLNNFSIPCVMTSSIGHKDLDYTGSFIRRFAMQFLKPRIQKTKFIRERKFNFDERILNIDGNVYLSGHWQTEKYFLEFRNEILSDFLLRFPLSKGGELLYSQIRTDNTVALHVRRGDYVTNGNSNRFHGVLPLSYYEKATQLLLSRDRRLKFYVFSDDTKWCMQNLNFLNGARFIGDCKGIPDYEQLYLMSKCNHNIVANSSFSWWGAWLNENSTKTVVAPKSWFQRKGINTDDLIPDGWIRL